MIDSRTWFAPGVLTFGSFVYATVLTANCFAKEPGDLEPAPLGAPFALNAPATGTTGATSSAGLSCFVNVTEILPNTTGDEQIKVVREGRSGALNRSVNADERRIPAPPPSHS